MSQLPVLLAVAVDLVLGESTRPATSNIRQYIIITVGQWLPDSQWPPIYHHHVPEQPPNLRRIYSAMAGEYPILD